MVSLWILQTGIVVIGVTVIQFEGRPRARRCQCVSAARRRGLVFLVFPLPCCRRLYRGHGELLIRPLETPFISPGCPRIRGSPCALCVFVPWRETEVSRCEQ